MTDTAPDQGLSTTMPGGPDPTDPGILVERGEIALAEGNVKQAGAYFQQALQRDGQNPDAWRGVGTICSRAQLFDQAVSAFRQCLQGNPQDLQALGRLAWVHIQAGQYESAIQVVRTCQSVEAQREAQASAPPRPAGPKRFINTETPSARYWEQRYRQGGNSGLGSMDALARFKAQVLNDFVARQQVRSVIEFGCGDGVQVSLSRYPDYLGLDVSPTVVQQCRQLFQGDPSKRFLVLEEYAGQQAELALSLDVIYHLVEKPVYLEHLEALFAAATRFVGIYSTDFDRPSDAAARHIHHRKFTDWVASCAPAWRLLAEVETPFGHDEARGKGTLARFFFYQRVAK